MRLKKPTLQKMKTKNMMTQNFKQSIGRSPCDLPRLLVVLTLAFFALSEKAQAVSPAPDGGYLGGNTAEGQSALLSLTTGHHNTAVGFLSLGADVAGSYNTAIGAGALLSNVGDPNSVHGSQNTATGFGALISNTIGFSNTANGALALFYNSTGQENTAIGVEALFHNNSSGGNTATGRSALHDNETGLGNTANGCFALHNSTTGNLNTAVGLDALYSNTIGRNNTAIGVDTLTNETTGTGNIALGLSAGSQQTSGSNNVYISAVPAVAGENNTCYIGEIFSTDLSFESEVFINSANKLGTMTCSKRFKKDIKPMDKASEALFALKPIAFRYKKEIDPAKKSQLGLVAEEVEKVNPDLVVRDQEGKPYSVRYDQVNAMLLNEFLKEHRRIETLTKHFESTIAQRQKTFESKLAAQQKQIEALTIRLQKVSAQLQASAPAPQTVLNNH